MNPDCLKLTCYFGERHRTPDGFVADQLLDIFGRAELATSIMMRGVEGFGFKHHLRTDASLTLSEDLPADLDVRSAAFWAAEAGHRVAHTAVHVHGGVGIDMDHPVHRYFLAAKQTEFAVGSATGALLAIGRELADTPA